MQAFNSVLLFWLLYVLWNIVDVSCDHDQLANDAPRWVSMLRPTSLATFLSISGLSFSILGIMMVRVCLPIRVRR